MEGKSLDDPVDLVGEKNDRRRSPMEDHIVFGDRMLPIKLPDTVQSAPPGLSTDLSPADDVGSNP